MPVYTPYTGDPARQGKDWSGGFSTGWWGAAYTAPTPIQSEVRPVVGGNASPLGRPIPTGIGVVVHTGDPVIDPKHLGGYRVVGDKVLVNLVFCILDTLLGGTFSLVWARANKDFIIRTQAPTRTINSPYRYYDGSQTAVDPVITQYLAAEFRTAWPGFVYIVLQDFDIAPYENTVPVFDFQIASSVTIGPVTEELSTILGPLDDPNAGGSTADDAENKYSTVDRDRSLHYEIIHPATVPTPHIGWVNVTDIATNREISRSVVTDRNGEAFRRLETPIALDGSNYFCCASDDMSPSPPVKLFLVNAFTGEIVHRLGAGTIKPYCISSIFLTAQKYLVFCDCQNASTTQSGLGIAVVDLATETMSWLVHPVDNPAGGTNTRVISLAAIRVADNSVLMFWTEQGRANFALGALLPEVRKATVTATSFTASVVYTEAESGKYPQGVVIDATDGGLVIVRDDGSLKKITSAGGIVYTTAAEGALAEFHINGNYWNDGHWFSYDARPGFAVGRIWPWYMHVVDLSDGSTTYVDIDIDGSDNAGFLDHHYFDQRRGWYTEGALEPACQIVKIAYGDATPDTIDLADIMLALSTFDGRHDAGDCAFTGFPGSECFGVKYESDTSIQDALRVLREPFDISIVESDGKLKFRYPPRDDAFAADLVLTDATKFVDQGQYTFEKVLNAEQESLRACEISFFDIDNYGEPGTPASFARPKGAYDITKSIDKRGYNLPLYMTASRALEQAALVVYRSVYALESYTGSLGPELAYVEPGDIVTFPFRDFIVTAQIKAATLNAAYTQNVTLVQYLQAHDATYTGAAISVPPITSTPFAWPVTTMPGSYEITGSTAGIILSSAPAFFAEAGSYAITGSAATLDYSAGSLTLAASAGSYAVTGSAATLTASGGDVLLTAGAGTYAVSGSAVTLKIGTTFTAGAGSYAIAGTAATLTTGAVDPNFANVKLLMGMEGTSGTQTFTDASPSARTFTPSAGSGFIRITNAQAKFGTCSLQTLNARITDAGGNSADFDFGSGQFTVEFFYRNNDDSSAFILGKANPTGSQLAWWIDRVESGAGTTSRLRFNYSTAGTAANVQPYPTDLLVLNTWYHICADRDGAGKTRFYFDGVMKASSTDTNAIFAASAAFTVFGYADGSGAANDTFIDELRITKGVGRYVSDSGFTVPTAAYPRS